MKKVYTSRYTDKSITVAQYLAERVCERLAQRDKIDLPANFWRLPQWKRIFLYQVQLANGLLKIYRGEAIIAALRKLKQVYSLGANFLDPVIQQEQKDILRKEAIATTISGEWIPPDTTEKPRPIFNDKKPTINKLREL